VDVAGDARPCKHIDITKHNGISDGHQLVALGAALSNAAVAGDLYQENIFAGGQRRGVLSKRRLGVLWATVNIAYRGVALVA